MDKIEIPFGAYDSETLGRTYTIPKGYTAKIEDGKIVVKKEELEDEKIKKSLVKFLKSLPIKHRCEYAASKLENWLAWLEKQQKDASKAIEAVDRIDKYIDEHVANAHDMKDSNPDKKYYRGWDDALGKMAGILQDVYSNEKQKESLHIEKTCKHNTLPIEQQMEAAMIAIRGEMPSKSQEWSEEDEKMLDEVLDRVTYAFYNQGLDGEIEDDPAFLWLHRLRPSWKPSEEQPEVDLEEEIDRFLKSEESTTYENAGSYKVVVKDPKKIAHHFYELGLKAKEG